MPPAAASGQTRVIPRLGLVCMTVGPQVHFQTITRTRYLALSPAGRAARLSELYALNLDRLMVALEFCDRHDIRLYRAISGLFPMSDEAIGQQVLTAMVDRLSAFGRRAEQLGIRVVQHPDQFVVLNSQSPAVACQSIAILEKHALAFDLLGLPRTPWSALIIHGGKGGRGDELVNVIESLPAGVRDRIALENDERCYSAGQIAEICRLTGVPMVFDAHHHAVMEKLDSYEHPSIARMVNVAQSTWCDPAWQLAHISNGINGIADPRHSALIRIMPSAYRQVPWIEVEAKGKERAIEHLRRHWPGLHAAGTIR